MINVIQIVLLSVIVLLSIILVILGVQVFFILKDFRQTVKKTNKILDDVDLITENVTSSVNSFSDIFGGASMLTTVLKIVKAFRQ